MVKNTYGTRLTDFFFFIAYPLRSESFFLLLTASWARSLSIINKMNKVVKENRCTLASYCLLEIFFTFTVFKCQSTWVPPYFSSIIINKRLFKFQLLCTKLSIMWLFLKVHCSGRHENTGTNRTTHSFFFFSCFSCYILSFNITTKTENCFYCDLVYTWSINYSSNTYI